MSKIGDRFLRSYESGGVYEYRVMEYNPSKTSLKLMQGCGVSMWESLKELRTWNVEWLVLNGVKQ